MKQLFYVEVAEFQPPDTVKSYFTGAFQAFIPDREVFTHPSSCILFSFSQNTSNYFLRRGFQSLRAQFLSENVSGKYCYL